MSKHRQKTVTIQKRRRIAMPVNDNSYAGQWNRDLISKVAEESTKKKTVVIIRRKPLTTH